MEIVYEYEGLSYLYTDPVYPVEEDSLLLIGAVRSKFNGTGQLIDMGCGSGLLTLVSAKEGFNVLSIDREPAALGLLRDNLKLNDISARPMISDLFDGIPRSYNGWADIISFNPPYLPLGRVILDRRTDLPLVGGKIGWELSAKFLSSAHRFLRKDGIIIILRYPQWRIDDMDPMNIYDRDVEIISTRDIDGERLEAIGLRIQH